MKQKEYHNYPKGTKIYPRDNSYQELIGTLPEWDGIDHSGDLYLKPCIVQSLEYNFRPEIPSVNVTYKGGVYRVIVSVYWDLTTPPTWFDEIDDFDDGPFC